MLEFILASIVSCDDAKWFIERVDSAKDLPAEIRREVVETIEEHSDCNSDANVG